MPTKPKKKLSAVEKAKLLLDKDYVLVPKKLKKGLTISFHAPPSEYYKLHVMGMT
jgi:hypothetical protein